MSRARGATPKATATFRREGDVWEISFGGAAVRMPHAKGLNDIVNLLCRPMQAIHVSELLAAQADGIRPSRTSAGDVLDDRARREMRSRLADLAADADEADAMNDPERADRIRTERDFVIHELAAALGLHGRDRRLDDTAERARKTVSARIHNSIGRMARLHPELARHLDRSIDTGLWCVYRPERPVDWTL